MNSKVVGVLFRKGFDLEEGFLGNEKLKNAFKVLADIAKQKDVRILISNFDNLFGNVLKRSYSFEYGWLENEKIDLIFDRAPSMPKTYQMKEDASKNVKILNNIGLNKLCWDKLLIYDYFSELVPRTFAVNSLEEFEEIKDKIGGEKIVLKPRWGIMGKDVQILNKNEVKEVNKGTIVQSFINAKKGIKELMIEGIHDLRVIMINGNIDHCYVRIAAEGSLFSNCAKGGCKKLIAQDKIPVSVLNVVKEVDKKLEKYQPRIYSIDFMFDSSGKPWIIELESIPGFAYYNGIENVRNKFLNRTVDLFIEA